MVKKGSKRSAKFSAKHDPFVVMLRTKRLQNLAKFKFVIASNQQKMVDESLAAWLKENPLNWSQRGYLFDLVRKALWKWNMLSNIDKTVYHDKWIAKGLPESLWLLLDARFDEIVSFTKTKNSNNIIVTFETDVFPYPDIDVNPVQTDYVKSNEVLPLPTEDYTQTPWRQKTVKYGSVDYKSFWSNTRMDKTIGLQTLIETVEPLKVDKTVQISTKLLDLLEALDCVAYWKFDEGIGTIAHDDTLNANDGTFVDTPLWVNGIKGKALSFDGIDDQISIPHSASLTGFKAFTLAAWVKCPTNTSPYSYIIIRTNIGNDILLQLSSSHIIYFGYNNGTTFIYTSCTAIADNNAWHFVSGVYNGIDLRIYLDGILVNVPLIHLGDIVQDSGHSTGIGGYNEVEWMNGIIDEVHVFNRALSQTEILELFFTERHKTTNISTAYESESGLHKTKSKTISIRTSEGNTVLASPSETSNINTTYETTVT